jgi:hypothetical protein
MFTETMENSVARPVASEQATARVATAPAVVIFRD